ncbi:MAG: hypothetical protein NZ519_06650 [Bacteroidia bacterium]|nr:hypothetical protein [Bacteroidia bacterium]MDW8301317.1 DUF4175 family protein [Bacteroidia bacterium]
METLLQNINAYIKKYYLYDVIKGSIWLLTYTLAAYWSLVLIEGFGNLSSYYRTVLFYGALCGFVGMLIWFVLRPSLYYYRILKGLTYEEAALQIGQHFPQVKDKLINVLHLSSTDKHTPIFTPEQAALLKASIEQKSKQLSPIPFADAIKLRENIKRLRLFWLFFGGFALTALIAPRFVTGSSYRLWNYDKEFIPPPPYVFIVEPGNTSVIKGEDLTLYISTKGKYLPENAYLFYKTNSQTQFEKLPLHKKGSKFIGEIKNITQLSQYYIGSDEVSSDIYQIQVLERPTIGQFQVILDYPEYTGKANDTLPTNVGDIYALAGTRAYWTIQAQATEKAQFVWADNHINVLEKQKNTFTYQKTLLQNTSYFIQLYSKHNIPNKDTVRYAVQVVPDKYPSILLENAQSEFKLDDRLMIPLSYEMVDDYGFSSLKIFYRFKKSNKAEKVSEKFTSIPLPFEPKNIQQKGTYVWDVLPLSIEPEEEIEYYLEVRDNDVINGYKAAKTPTLVARFPSVKEMLNEASKNSNSIAEGLSEISKQAQKLNEEYQKLQQKLLQQNKMDWQDKKQLQELIQQQQELRKKAEQISKQMEREKQKLQNNNLISEDLTKKYEELQKILKELKNPKLEELMRRMQELMQKMNFNELKKDIEELKKDSDKLKEELNRMLELFKRLQLEQKLENLIKQLQEMAKKQNELANKTESKDAKKQVDELQKQQDLLDKQMDEVKKELNEIGDLQKELDKQENSKNQAVKQDADKVKQDMQQSKENMNKGNMNKAAKNQKDAAQKMQQMADALAQMKAEGELEQEQANIEDLRQILENTLSLSFEQEALKEEVKNLKHNNPNVKSYARKQDKLIDDFKMVADSLRSLARKAPQIKGYVSDEVRKIQEYQNQSKKHLENRYYSPAITSAQYATTSLNNLANMLSEALEQMQQDVKNKMPGSAGACKKPGGKGKSRMSLQELAKKQEEMMKQLEQLIKEGKGENGKNLSEAQKNALKRMAAEQEALRQQLEELAEQMKNGAVGGNGGENNLPNKDKATPEGEKILGDLSKIAEQMEENEKDLMNFNITPETFIRQQQIVTRLLNATRSLRERDIDDEREAQQAKEVERKSPAQIEIEKQREQIRRELLKSLQPGYTIDYQNLIRNYYYELEKQNLKR